MHLTTNFHLSTVIDAAVLIIEETNRPELLKVIYTFYIYSVIKNIIKYLSISDDVVTVTLVTLYLFDTVSYMGSVL
jgi:hypothetical protein